MGACGVGWWHEYSLKESPQMDRFATFPGFRDGLYLICFCGTDWNDGVVGIGEAHQSSARLHQKQLSLGGDVWDNGGVQLSEMQTMMIHDESGMTSQQYGQPNRLVVAVWLVLQPWNFCRNPHPYFEGFFTSHFNWWWTHQIHLLNLLVMMCYCCTRWWSKIRMITIQHVTLWLFNMAMENRPFIDGLPIKNGDFPWLC